MIQFHFLTSGARERLKSGSAFGQPDATAKAGGSWMVPADAPHSAKAGPQGATAIVNYVVDKTKPTVSPSDPNVGSMGGLGSIIWG